MATILAALACCLDAIVDFHFVVSAHNPQRRFAFYKLGLNMACHKCEQNEATTTFAGQPVCGDCFDILKRTNPSKLVAFLASTQNGKSATTPANLFTVHEAAERLSVSVRTVYRLIESGELQHTKIGTSVRIKPAALERYLAHQSRSSGSLFG